MRPIAEVKFIAGFSKHMKIPEKLWLVGAIGAPNRIADQLDAHRCIAATFRLNLAA
jgi:hypothetical protein